jgi:hypothetical protein
MYAMDAPFFDWHFSGEHRLPEIGQGLVSFVLFTVDRLVSHLLL